MSDSGHHIVIGSDGAAFAVARAVKERGYRATVLVPRGAPAVGVFPGDLRVKDLNLGSVKELAAQFGDAECIYYCAGTTQLPIDETEPDRVALVVQACARTEARLLYSDIAYSYGAVNRPVSEDMPLRATDPFGVFLSSLAGHVLRAWQMGRVRAVIARHADLYGPEVVRSPFGERFVAGVLRGHHQYVPGRPDAARSLTYAPDFGRAAVLLAEQSDVWGQVWHVPTSAPIDPAHLAEKIRLLAGLKPIHHQVSREGGGRSPFSLLVGEKLSVLREGARLNEAEFRVLSTKFERAFGMHATPVKDALLDTMAFVQHQVA